MPTNSPGRQVKLERTFTIRVLSDESARRCAEDLELEYSKANHHKEYLITASSVLLMK